MKRMICAVMALLMIVLSLCGCSKEDPAKAEMRAMAGENQEITGAYDEALAARCRNGTFVGLKEGNVIAFKGVPFAEPPVGALRWKPPVPAAAGEYRRLELRSPDSSANPYLAFALILSACLYGIQEVLPLPPAADFNTFQASSELLSPYAKLPVDLSEAQVLASRSEFLRKLLPKEIIQAYCC